MGQRTGAILLNLHVSEGLTEAQLAAFVSTVKAVFPDHEKLSIFATFISAQKGAPTQSFEMHLAGPTRLHERFEITACNKTFPLDFWISPTAFLQPNSLQAEKIYSRMLEIAQPKADWRVIDLYCGVGAIGFAFAPFVKEVIGLELNPYAIYDGEYIAEKNGMKNVRLIAASSSEWGSIAPVANADLLIVDPPRAGLDPKTLKTIGELEPQRILYVSCNPASQATDLEILLSMGYNVVVMSHFDQFPHTPHIENIVFLTRAVL